MAASVSLLVMGAGMTAALFLLLGVGFSLQLYRRRRQQILRQIPSGWTTVLGSQVNAAAAGGEQQLAQLAQISAMSALCARAATIEALPTRVVAASEAAQAAAEAVECSICLGDLAAGDALAQLPCGHEFHGPCIRKWLWGTLAATCPLCKAPLSSVAPPVSTTNTAPGSPSTTPVSPVRVVQTFEVRDEEVLAARYNPLALRPPARLPDLAGDSDGDATAAAAAAAAAAATVAVAVVGSLAV